MAGLAAISASALPPRCAEVLIFSTGVSPNRGLGGQKCRCHRHRTGPLGVDHCGPGPRPQTTPPSGGGLHPRAAKAANGRLAAVFSAGGEGAAVVTRALTDIA